MEAFDLQIPKKGATLRLIVEDKIRQAISAGHFRPGQRLVERELCEQMGVGRTSVREALRQLEAEGLITSHPHRGPSVASISLEEARQLYAVRAILESYAGREFAKVGTEEEIARLEAAGVEFELSSRRHEADPTVANRNRLVEAKSAFYRRLMEGSHNIFIEQTLNLLNNRITLLRVTSMTQPGRLSHSLEEIREIVAAIRARDGERAAEACRHHIDMAAETAFVYLAGQEGN